MTTDVIILNRMYVGDYLDDNLGHEAINLIKPDNNESYCIYINDLGDVNEQFYTGKKNACCILLTRKVAIKGIKNTVEIIAKAEELELVAAEKMSEIKATNKEKRLIGYHGINKPYAETITYSGEPLYKIYANNKWDYRAIYFTYFAKTISRPMHPLYLMQEDTPNKDKIIEFLKKSGGNVILIKDYPYATSLKTYIDENDNASSFNILKKIIDDKNKEYWSCELPDEDLKNVKYRNNNVIDILKKNNDEIIHSNLIAYIFKSNPKLCCDFIKNFYDGKININDSEKFEIIRESEGNIDILIKDDDNHTLIAIENKIKSDINGGRHDLTGELVTNQLEKYVHYLNGEVWKENKDGVGKYVEDEKLKNKFSKYSTKKFIFLCPKYNRIDIKSINKFYDDLTYEKLYEYYDENSAEMLTIPHFKEFMCAIYRHKFDTYNLKEQKMFENFEKRIEELNKKI